MENYQSDQPPVRPFTPEDNQPPVPGCDHPASCYKTLLKTLLNGMWIYTLGLLGLSVALSIVYGILDSLLRMFFAVGISYETASNFLLILTTIGSFLITAAYLQRKLHLPLRQELESPLKWKGLLAGVCCMYGVAVPLNMLTLKLSSWLQDIGYDLPAVGNYEGSAWSGIVCYLITAVVLAPICEEIILRGMVLESLKKYSPSFALVFSSLLFSLLHLNLYQGIGTFGIGLVIGFLYLKTDSLKVAILMHLTNNAVSVLLQYVPYPAVFLIEILLIILTLAGWGIMVRCWPTITKTLKGSAESRQLWSCACRRLSFWLLVLAFGMSSLWLIGGW